ncbi:alpha/beta hydrolase [Wenyingzhuangia sp. chi5]|uniref:Alpha/beta hydrolase n=1 Tax=Wenyingzhuangia gilva TaxID=3057677 RepID=A0ABT8VUC0_9FLAO|nr:alpha/beta hydrolase [Wenyingzhuangia sp. chi5]MDO3695571.1 alpha/beta hydrolase [Wenyingzhuangia sp. chi5]
MRFKYLKLAVLMFFLPLTTYALKLPDLPKGWSDGYVYSNGVRIHFYHAVPAPEKPVMVMVHGVTDNGVCWTDVSLKLQDSYNIYMLDTRGHGLSDPFTPSDDEDTLINDVVDFVKVMNFVKPILVGHSMGAATVMRVGAEYPDLAKTIIMLDPGLPRKTSAERPQRRNTPPKRNEQKKSKPDPLSFRMMGSPESLVKQNNYSFEDLVTKGSRENPKWSKRDVLYWALSKKQYHGPYTNAAWTAMSGSMRTEGALAKIPVKSLILKADTSAEKRKINQESIAGMKRVKLVHVDDARHNLHHDELKRTVKEIKEFLNTI